MTYRNIEYQVQCFLKTDCIWLRTSDLKLPHIIQYPVNTTETWSVYFYFCRIYKRLCNGGNSKKFVAPLFFVFFFFFLCIHLHNVLKNNPISHKKKSNFLFKFSDNIFINIKTVKKKNLVLYWSKTLCIYDSIKRLWPWFPM